MKKKVISIFSAHKFRGVGSLKSAQKLKWSHPPNRPKKPHSPLFFAGVLKTKSHRKALRALPAVASF